MMQSKIRSKTPALTGIVLAAGEGKRMNPLGADLPKVMLPILGKPVLDHVVSNLIEAGINKIILVVSPNNKTIIKKNFGANFKQAKILYVLQEQQVGPAQAVSKVLSKVKSKYFLVQYGDSLADINIPKAMTEVFAKNPSTSGVLAIRKVDDPSRYGIVKYQNGKIIGVVEKPDVHSASSQIAVMGTFILNTKDFKDAVQGQSFKYGKELFPPQYVLAKGRGMSSFLFEGRRVDVGKPEDIFSANQLLAESPIKCIAFDADNTLYNTHQVAKIADFDALEILAEATRQSVESLYKEWKKIVQGVIGSKDPVVRRRPYSYAKLCQKYHKNPKVAQKMFEIFTRTLLKNLKTPTGLVKILKSLPQEKYVFTEDINQLALKKLKYLKINKYFKDVIASDKVKIMKPSEKYYTCLLKKFRPEEILVVGDDWQRDLQIPTQLGMQGLFVENEKSLQKLLELREPTPPLIEPFRVNIQGVPLKKLHIMGIAGSGASAVAGIAQAFGIDVSGCDLNPQSPYTKNFKIKIANGHSSTHIEDIDALIISPAVTKFDPKNQEILTAKEKNIPVMTWQEFQGKILQKDKFVITVAGAYGKSTTTSMIAQVLIDAGLDPTCEIGAKVLSWVSNYRVGQSKYYVCESDEYNNNFLNYHPDIAVVLNVAWDHPDFFKTKKSVVKSYKKFVSQIKPGGVLIISSKQDLNSLTKSAPINIKVIKIEDFGKLKLSIVGDFRKENANAALTVAKSLGIDVKKARKSVEKFKGVGRRLELKGDIGRVKVFDDYAVQPYTVKTTTLALKKKFPHKKMVLVFEPHTFTRISIFFKDFVNSLRKSGADKILITEIFSARETGDQKALSRKLANAVGKKAKFTGSIGQTSRYLSGHLKEFDIICSMGAGNSYRLYELLKSKHSL